MFFSKLYIFDADQYSLRKYLTPQEIRENRLIAASNTQVKLEIEGRVYGKCVPIRPQSADDYLVEEFEKFVQYHSAKQIIIATRDKKLLLRLLTTLPKRSQSLISIHHSCPFETKKYFYDILLRLEKEDLYQHFPLHCLSPLDMEISGHISKYPNGLRFKTLLAHLGYSESTINHSVNRLLSMKIICKINNCLFN